MSLSVSYNQNLKTGIDASALKEVTQQIFQRANTQNSVLANADLTKFNRPSLGTDLYKVKAETASQIAMTNSGVQVNLSENTLSSLKYLNSQASKSIFKNVDGRITVAEGQDLTKTQKTEIIPTFGKLTETADLGADKRGSNPFYKGELLNIKKEEEKEEVLNIFA